MDVISVWGKLDQRINRISVIDEIWGKKYWNSTS